MPPQKSQHFVPQVYMRPFASDPDRKTINLYNVERHKLVSCAAIKHQCAANYFYGNDKILENQFGEIEGRYAEIARQISRGEFAAASSEWLQLFIALQYSRTLYAVEQARDFHERSAAITFKGRTISEGQKPELTKEYVVGVALSRFLRFAPYTKDLKFCILRNRTCDAFITSDCPVVFTNRYHIQQLNRNVFGAASSGALLVMPVDPAFTVCLYDKGVYSVESNGGIVDVVRKGDVLALNELQYLNAHENIYFYNFDDGDRIASEFECVSDIRLAESFRFTEMAEVTRDGKKVGYRIAESQADADSGRSKLIFTQTVFPRPRRWPTVIGFRSNKIVYEKRGSPLSPVRNPQWYSDVKLVW